MEEQELKVDKPKSIYDGFYEKLMKQTAKEYIEKMEKYFFYCCARSNGKSLRSDRKLFEILSAIDKESLNIYYTRASTFKRMKELYKEMFVFNELNLKYYFKGTDIEIYLTENLPKGINGFFANKTYLKGGEE